MVGSALFSLAQAADHRQRRERARRAASRARRSIRYGLLLIGASIVEGVFLYLQRWIIIGASRHIEYDMRNDFYEHLQKLPLALLPGAAHRRPDVARDERPRPRCACSSGPAMMHSLSSLLVVTGSFVMMLRIDAMMALLALIAVPIVAGLVKYFGQRIHVRTKAVQDYFGDISARVQENLAGVRVVRAFTREDERDRDVQADEPRVRGAQPLADPPHRDVLSGAARAHRR